MTLADAGKAIDIARRIKLDRATLPERKACLFLDDSLLTANQVAAEEVRARPIARQLIAELAVRGPHSVRARATDFAEQAGIAL